MPRHDQSIHVHPGNDVIALFPNADSATAACAALMRSGAAGDAVVVGDDQDRAAAIDAEMQLELARGVITFRNLTSRHGRMPSYAAMAGLAVGAAIAVSSVVAIIPFGGSYLERFLIVAVVAGAMALMVSVLAIGAIMSARGERSWGPDTSVTVHVHEPTDEMCAKLVELRPLRLDEITTEGRVASGLHLAGGISMSPPGQHAVGW
jgi:hypothetical protein